MPARPVGEFAFDCLNSRFCYWQSNSGVRYIFTQIQHDDIASFSDCVLLIATDSQEGQGPHVHWIGEISALSPLSFRHIDSKDLQDIEFYVHLLSGGQDERAQMIADLSHGSGREACRLIA